MTGTTPIFIRIPVTRELCEGVMSGRRPDHSTEVYYYEPTLPDWDCGMRSVRNRRVIFGLYEAFKKYVPENKDGFSSVEIPNYSPQPLEEEDTKDDVM
jgi:hypothetical protein